MDARWLLLLLVTLLAGVRGEGTCPAPASAPTVASLALQALKEVPGVECRRQMALVIEGIHNLTDWALSMADATAKLPAGLLRGNLRALGDMDECVAVGPDATGAPVRGKYCLASAHADADSESLARLLDVATAGRQHLEFRHRQIDLGNGVVVQSPGFVPELSRVEWGVCVPAACARADVEAALSGLARRLLAGTALRLDIRVPEEACQTSDGPARPLGAGHYAFLIICGILVTLVIIGTWNSTCKDENTYDSNSYKAVLDAFSLRTSWQRLTSERSEGIGCISGMRTLSSMFMVFAHESLYFPQEPSINKTKIAYAITSILYTPLMTGIIVVDTLFTISGVLYTYIVADSIIDRSFNYVHTLVFRFLRLSPVYYMLVWFYATFLEYLGQGPNWEHFINYNVKSCREHWIWNILYVNNYANVLTVCVPQSWFLATDMQLVALAPLVVLPLYRWRRGRTIVGAWIAVAVAATATSVIILRLPGLYRAYDTDFNILSYMLNNHTRTHVHSSSWLVGVVLGYILHKIKNKKISLNTASVALGWTVSSVFFALTSIGPFYMLQKSYEYNLLDSAAYPALGRLLWAVGVCWIIFACHTGYGGLLNRLLNCYALRVISRLSYTMNLTHFILLLHNGGRRRIPIWIDEFSWIQMFIADYMIAMAVSFVLYVIIESPLCVISRTFLFKNYSKKTKTSHSVSNGIKHE